MDKSIDKTRELLKEESKEGQYEDEEPSMEYENVFHNNFMESEPKEEKAKIDFSDEKENKHVLESKEDTLDNSQKLGNDKTIDPLTIQQEEQPIETQNSEMAPQHKPHFNTVHTQNSAESWLQQDVVENLKSEPAPALKPKKYTKKKKKIGLLQNVMGLAKAVFGGYEQADLTSIKEELQEEEDRDKAATKVLQEYQRANREQIRIKNKDKGKIKIDYDNLYNDSDSDDSPPREQQYVQTENSVKLEINERD